MSSTSTVVVAQPSAEAQQNIACQRAKVRGFVIKLIVVWLGIFVTLGVVFNLLRFDVNFMFDRLDFIIEGIEYTLIVSAAGITVAIILALIGALGRLSRNPIANAVATFYVSFIRGTPLLVQVYVWYLGLPQIGQQLEAIGLAGAQKLLTLPAIPAGVLALGVCYGAYMTETFRAGIQSIRKGQTEAAYSVGMTPSQTMRRIILPQALRVVIPPIGNDFVAMIKDSSLVSVMGVWELTYRATKMGRRYFRSLETLTVAAIVYWVMCIVLQALQARLEAHMGRGERK
ncbi:MAG: amino acid ABC transporter permease [Chloroflexi bacterium]|nr:amino acid ABC transporter permease [Chloroflexota bacterium]